MNYSKATYLEIVNQNRGEDIYIQKLHEIVLGKRELVFKEMIFHISADTTNPNTKYINKKIRKKKRQ